MRSMGSGMAVKTGVTRAGSQAGAVVEDGEEDVFLGFEEAVEAAGVGVGAGEDFVPSGRGVAV